MADSTSMKTRIRIFHANQCDPKKCTGHRMIRMKLAGIITDIRRIPRSSIVLNPVSETALSQEDSKYMDQGGIIALDCSWKQAEDIFRRSRNGVQRALPYLLAANPINTYKPVKLSTAEAIAAALYILGRKEESEQVMSVFKWGPSFLTLNREWLDSYAECKTSKDIVSVQKEIMDEQTRSI